MGRWALLAAAVALAWPAALAAGYDEGEASWHFTTTAKRKHPPNLELTIRAPEDMPEALLCALYANNLPKVNRGIVEFNFVVRRADGSQGNFRERVHVANNLATPACVELAIGLRRNDTVVVEVAMSHFGKVKPARGDRFEVHGGAFADEATAQAAMTRWLANRH
jgi:hypothetical protein